jgi:SWI/SNF-related matrix-associated actin-dependent regulator of chromatin subfamily A protein 2/4
LLRRKKNEVEKYLPSKTQVILKCDFSAWQKAYYEQVTSDGRVALGSGKLYYHSSIKYFLAK